MSASIPPLTQFSFRFSLMNERIGTTESRWQDPFGARRVVRLLRVVRRQIHENFPAIVCAVAGSAHVVQDFEKFRRPLRQVVGVDLEDLGEGRIGALASRRALRFSA